MATDGFGSNTLWDAKKIPPNPQGGVRIVDGGGHEGLENWFKVPLGRNYVGPQMVAP